MTITGMKAALVALLLCAAPLHGAQGRVTEAVAPAGDTADARRQAAMLPRATAVNDADGDKIFDEVEAAAGPRSAVIVSFRQDVSTDDGIDAVRRVAPGVEVTDAFHIIPAFAGKATMRQIDEIAALDVVRQVELDDPGDLELQTATEVMGADAVVDEMGITGSLDGSEAFSTGDVGIAVLDTGIHENHLDLFGGKIVEFVDLGGGCQSACDPNGHGTHVASIAAGLGRVSPQHRGVAPGASIIGIKIEGTNGAVESNAIRGYELIVDRRDELGIRVATISFGFGPATDGTTALERAVDAAWDAGIVTFKSAGNSGPGSATITVPGAARGVLAIGSILDHGGTGALPAAWGLGVSSFSSRGPTSDGRIKPDLLAPGQSITAARAGSATGYTTLSGTSMASPFAAGSAALMIAAVPSLTPDAVRAIMRATAEDWGTAGPDNDHGWGRIQVREALRAAIGGVGGTPPPSLPPATPRHEVVTGPGPVLEGAFEVTSTEFPIRATAISELGVLDVEVRAPDGTFAPLGRSLDPGARQYSFSFVPSQLGIYTFRVVATGPVVLDLSHSRA